MLNVRQIKMKRNLPIIFLLTFTLSSFAKFGDILNEGNWLIKSGSSSSVGITLAEGQKLVITNIETLLQKYDYVLEFRVYSYYPVSAYHYIHDEVLPHEITTPGYYQLKRTQSSSDNTTTCLVDYQIVSTVHTDEVTLQLSSTRLGETEPWKTVSIVREYPSTDQHYFKLLTEFPHDSNVILYVERNSELKPSGWGNIWSASWGFSGASDCTYKLEIMEISTD